MKVLHFPFCVTDSRCSYREAELPRLHGRVAFTALLEILAVVCFSSRSGVHTEKPEKSRAGQNICLVTGILEMRFASVSCAASLRCHTEKPQGSAARKL